MLNAVISSRHRSCDALQNKPVAVPSVFAPVSKNRSLSQLLRFPFAAQ
jgi:hypothetical protein